MAILYGVTKFHAFSTIYTLLVLITSSTLLTPGLAPQSFYRLLKQINLNESFYIVRYHRSRKALYNHQQHLTYKTRQAAGEAIIICERNK